MAYFRVTRDKTVECGVHRMEIWIPRSYFDAANTTGNATAELNDESVTTTALFRVAVYSSADAKPTFKNFAMGATITLRRHTSRFDTIEDDEYLVLEYHEDDIIMSSNSIIQSNMAFADTIGIVLLGRVPRGVRYPDVYHVAVSAARTNGYGLGIPSSLLEALIAVLCRTKSGDRPYRRVLNRDPGMTRYRMFGVDRVAQIISTFGITFERLDESIPYAVNRKRKNIPEPEIPIEDTL